MTNLSDERTSGSIIGQSISPSDAIRPTTDDLLHTNHELNLIKQKSYIHLLSDLRRHTTWGEEKT